MRPLLIALAVVLVAFPASADTLYEYTSATFDTWSGLACQGDCALSVSFVTPVIRIQSIANFDPFTAEFLVGVDLHAAPADHDRR